MLRTTATICAILGALYLVSACGGNAAAKAPKLAATPLGLENAKLAGLDKNPLTAEKAHLGKQLFFDTRLSSKGEMSCETCHQHAKGWTNGEQFSTKENGQQNTRNSPTLYNVGYHQRYYYWDGRAATLEDNIKAAWTGHMGGDPDAMATKLAAIDAYKAQFDAAFPGQGATGDNIVAALASFVRTLRSGDSRYDRKELTANEQKGQMLFIARCASCHQHATGLFTDELFHNVGVGDADKDPGRHKHDSAAAKGSFKTPSLRSVAKTAPYFHDGSVADLREAVKIMSSFGIDNPNLDPILRAFRSSDAMKPATDEEIDQLVAFLKALTSEEKFEAPTLPK